MDEMIDINGNLHHIILPPTGQGLLQKVRKGRGTRVALTAAHSSAVAEECIRVVRKLHSTADWGAKINDFACLKLRYSVQIKGSTLL